MARRAPRPRTRFETFAAAGAAFGAALVIIACSDDARTLPDAVRADSGGLSLPDAGDGGPGPSNDAGTDSAPTDSGFDADDGACAPLALRPPLLPTSYLPAAKLGQFYSISFNAGGKPPLVYSLAGGEAPPGLTLDPTTGVLSGTPGGPAPFTYTYAIYVTDSCSQPQSADGTYNHDVEP